MSPEQAAATPAMVAGVTKSPWEIEDLVRMIEDAAPAPKRPSAYRKAEVSN